MKPEPLGAVEADRGATQVTHTPGPWCVETLGHTVRVVSGVPEDGPFGDDVIVIGDLYDKTAQADARLIAAAPDLLEAAKHAAMEWRLHGQLTDSCRVLERAIAKAEGQ